MVTSGRFVSAGPADAPDGWERSVSRLHGEFRIDVPNEQASFRGRLDWHASASYRLVSWFGEPERLVRGEREIRKDPVAMYELVVPLAGEVVLESRGRSAKLGPGDMALASLNSPVSTTHVQRCWAVGFLVPEAEVRHQVSRAAPLTYIDRRAGLGNVAFETLMALSRQAGSMTDPVLDSAARHLLDLLMLASRTAYSNGADHAAEIEAAIREQVRRRVGDATLSGESIAAGLGWSLRRVQQILRGAGTTPSELIRTERLRAARDLLIAPGDRRLAVGEVSQRCGFTSHASFCRAFRAEFGTSPTSLRESARTVKK